MQPYEFRHVRGGSWHAGFALAGRRSSRPLHVHPLCTRLFDRRGHEERDPQQASGHNPLRAGRGSGRQSATPLIEMSPRALERLRMYGVYLVAMFFSRGAVIHFLGAQGRASRVHPTTAPALRVMQTVCLLPPRSNLASKDSSAAIL